MEFSYHNYELYALDFLEGNLSPEDEEKFRNFLAGNPDLKRIILSGEDLSLSPGKTIYPNKEFLRRTTADLIQTIPKPDLECISLLEEKVHQDNSIEIMLSSLKNSSDRELLLLYKKIILKPGNEKFPAKSNLKKPIPVRKQFYWWGSVAAILVLALMIRILFVSGPLQEIVSDNSGNNIVVPAQNSNREIPVSVGVVPEETESPSGFYSVEGQSIVPAITENKTVTALDESQALSSKAIPAKEVYAQLTPLSLVLPQTSLPDNQLKPPVIYIPRVLTQQDLLALENYTIENFHIKLLDMNPPLNPGGKKFISAIKSIVELVTALTGSNMDINTSYNNSGRLTSFDLTSEHLKFSTHRKSD